MSHSRFPVTTSWWSRADVARALGVASVLGVFMTVSAALPRPVAAADFKKEYDKAVAAFSAGDYTAALAGFTAAYKAKPHPLCLFGMGQSHRKLEHYDEAITAYEKFLATKPAPDMKAEVEGYLAGLRKAKEARVDLEEARRLFTGGDFAGAAARYEHAHSIHPLPSTLYSIALSHERAGNRVKAIEYYELFLKTDTDPKLRAEGEAALKALRAEPDPVGTMGVAKPPPLATGDPTSPALERIDDPEPPAPRKGGGILMYAAIGGGAAVVVGVAVTVITAVVITSARHGGTDLGYMTTDF